MKKKILILLLPIFIYGLIVLTNNKNTDLKLDKNNYREGAFEAVNASEYLISKANGENVNDYNNEESKKGEMFVFSHEQTEQTSALTDYRYIGDNPNNYVYFNCKNPNNTELCEVWRIIGVFDVEKTDPNDSTKTITEKRVKLVKGSALVDTNSWGYNNYWNNSGLNKYLNDNYYKKISKYSISQIDNAIYYLGGTGYNSNYGSAENIYKWERSNNVSNGNPIKWEGSIALMYPSDMYMVYADGVEDSCSSNPKRCYDSRAEKGWIYNSNWIQGNTVSAFTWLLSPCSDWNSGSFISNSDGSFSYLSTTEKRAIRPVLYLKSDVKINAGDGSKEKPYVLYQQSGESDSEDTSNYDYNIGDFITYKNNNYYVIENSKPDQEYITLLRSQPFAVEEIYKYGKDEKGNYFVNDSLVNYKNSEELVFADSSGAGGIAYYSDESCRAVYRFNGSNYEIDSMIVDSCTNNYDSSAVKKIIDNWEQDNFDDELVNVDGYTSRILKNDDVLKFANIYKGNYENTFEYKFEKIPNIVSNSWMMDEIENKERAKFISSNSKISDYYIKKIVYKKFYFGDKINYQGNNYHVLSNSTNSLTLIKNEPLTIDELNQYGIDKNGNNILNQGSEGNVGSAHIFQDNVDIGGMNYYSSSTCKVGNTTGCISKYDDSNVKVVVDNWAKENAKEEDLVEIDGYKARILNTSKDVYTLNYEMRNDGYASSLVPTENTPTWIYNNYYSLWTMTKVYNYDYTVYKILASGSIYGEPENIFKTYGAVLPIINVDKCAIEGGCEIVYGKPDPEKDPEIIEVDDPEIIEKDPNIVPDEEPEKAPDKEITIVEVENTLKSISIISIVVGIIMVVIGTFIYKKNHKSVNNK